MVKLKLQEKMRVARCMLFGSLFIAGCNYVAQKASDSALQEFKAIDSSLVKENERIKVKKDTLLLHLVRTEIESGMDDSTIKSFMRGQGDGDSVISRLISEARKTKKDN